MADAALKRDEYDNMGLNYVGKDEIKFKGINA